MTALATCAAVTPPKALALLTLAFGRLSAIVLRPRLAKCHLIAPGARPQAGLPRDIHALHIPKTLQPILAVFLSWL